MSALSVPEGWDAVTWVHSLCWKVQCYEKSGEDFQKLFEEVMTRVNPKFISVRPYGRIGDRKCDGYLKEDDGITVFQVYSPDEMTQKKVQAKIEEDLAGAFEHWNKHGLKRWTFVYNCKPRRGGLAPDVPSTLKIQQSKYPNIEIDHMSSDALWEKVRELTLQQRCEILGPPFEHGNLFFLPDGVGSDVVDKIRKGHFVIIHGAMSPINLKAVANAVAPDALLGSPLHIRPYGTDWRGESSDEWKLAAAQQRWITEDVMEKSRDLLPRFAVFSLAPVPLALHLGFLFSDRVEVRAFQFDRDCFEWSWPTEGDSENAQVHLSGIPNVPMDEPCEIGLRISVSARVSESDARTSAPNAKHHIEIHVSDPNIMWLRSTTYLRTIKMKFRETLRMIRERFPKCSKIHLFAAIPTPVAIALGQEVNPRMNPPIALYEYSRQRTPRYRFALTLEEAS